LVGEWTRAQEDFFEAFKNYDETGSPRRIACLKYLVLANMLMESKINPFDGQETKPYKNDSEVVAMGNLVSAYQAGDLVQFQKILKGIHDCRLMDVAADKRTILADPFIDTYMSRILQKIRSSVLVEMVKPYTRIKLDFCASELGIDVEEVEGLVVDLILDDRIRGGKIDQVGRVLKLSGGGGEDAELSEFYGAVGKWAGNSMGLFRSVAKV
jgi:COP9 signalosome complex subunit 2